MLDLRETHVALRPKLSERKQTANEVFNKLVLYFIVMKSCGRPTQKNIRKCSISQC